MTEKQLRQVQSQLPDGTQILRLYRAFEGDYRVIAKTPGDNFEKRYTIKFENDYPRIQLMP
ncbi:MAG: hypothetical protein BWY15_01962 [Firmicutes bacterium ADurb.Bin193]|nr:MAG: hypothetical protein BWY15_01962 [Firmicutes bacterium ADurb.Bin193]